MGLIQYLSNDEFIETLDATDPYEMNSLFDIRQYCINAEENLATQSKLKTIIQNIAHGLNKLMGYELDIQPADLYKIDRNEVNLWIHENDGSSSEGTYNPGIHHINLRSDARPFIILEETMHSLQFEYMEVTIDDHSAVKKIELGAYFMIKLLFPEYIEIKKEMQQGIMGIGHLIDDYDENVTTFDELRVYELSKEHNIEEILQR